MRKKGGSYMVADLSKVLTPEVVAPDAFVDTEFLVTVVVVVPKSLENEWLANYECLDDNAVGYGPAEDRESIRGSPVVPRSARRICVDKDGNVIYLTTILRLYEESFKEACRGRRFTVRQFRPSADGSGNDDGVSDEKHAAEDVEQEYNVAVRSLVQWCRAHYGEVFSAWMHVKAIRVFVESVLRYGLPVDFTAALVWPHKRSYERKIRSKLRDVWTSIGGAQDDFHDDGASVAGDAEEYFPYVSFNLSPRGGEQINSSVFIF